MPAQYAILTTWIILLAIRNNRLKDQCIRSKSKLIEEGEKPTKYFINLKTRNYVSKQIPNIKKDNGSVIFDQMEILHEKKCWYENLYKKGTVKKSYM